MSSKHFEVTAVIAFVLYSYSSYIYDLQFPSLPKLEEKAVFTCSHNHSVLSLCSQWNNGLNLLSEYCYHFQTLAAHLIRVLVFKGFFI